MEKKRERRRRDLARKKAAVKRYRWYVPKETDARAVGIAANTNHTCGICGHNRLWYGPSVAERRNMQDEE